MYLYKSFEFERDGMIRSVLVLTDCLANGEDPQDWIVKRGVTNWREIGEVEIYAPDNWTPVECFEGD